MTSFSIKILAAVTMVIQHTALKLQYFFGGSPAAGVVYDILVCVGAISMPLFAFLIAEGFFHTKDSKRYIIRIGLFALLSEIPLDLFRTNGQSVFDWKVQNILFSFLLALLALEFYTRFMRRGLKFPAFISIAAFAAAAQLLRFDYGCFAVTYVFLFYILRGKRHETLFFLGAAMLSYAFYVTISFSNGWRWAFQIFALIPIMFYNGRQGPKKQRWLFYIFYPVHLLILAALCAFLKG